MHALPSSSYRFDNFELDVARRRLLRDGRSVTLNPKAFDMLRVLVEHNGKLVTKEDLFRLVWDGQFVEESNLTVNMSAIRRALGETASDPRYITTVSGRGYTFIADLRSETEDEIVIDRTLSRVVVEEIEKDDDPLDHVSSVPALTSAAAESRRRSYIFLAVGLVLAGSVLSLWYFLLRDRTGSPFERTSIKRLTSSGRITNGTISPDGKLFVYSQEELDGRSTLLLEHIDGSRRIELLPPAFASYISLTFTPDGGRIYYGVMSEDPAGSGLYRIPAFGGPPEKIKDRFWSRVAFSPDGNRFAFVRGDSMKRQSTLWVADPHWQTEQEIATRPAEHAFVTTTVDWAPDGRRIVVSAVSDTRRRKQELFIVDVADGSIKQLTNLNWDGIRSVSWLGTGDGIIASAGNQEAGVDSKLWHISESDGRARRIVSDLNTYGIMRLSADKKVLLTAQSQLLSNIWIAPADDLAAAQQITFDMLGAANGWLGLEWLPDGRLVYTSYKNRGETIWAIDSDGRNPQQMVPDGGRNHNLSVSADGQLIAFESDRGGTDEIWLSKIDGSGLRQLTDGGNNHEPHIDPNGKFVIYRSLRDGLNSLWRISIEGNEPPTRFTHHVSGWARVSPDGKLVACNCMIEGRSKLCIFPAGGGEPVKHFDLPPRANLRLGPHWMPGGNAVTYRDWSHGIWKQELAGGEPVRLPGLPEEKLFAYGWSVDGKRFAYARGMAIQDLVLITSEN